VRVAGEADDVGRDPARLQLVDLGEEDLRVDHAPRAEHAFLAGDDPARDLADLERLAAGDDRVAGVRTALVAAHDVRGLGEQVDDLPLALVAPLRADDHGRWHVRGVCQNPRPPRGSSTCARFSYRSAASGVARTSAIAWPRGQKT